MFIVPKFWRFIWLGIILCSISALAAVFVCPQCGYENAEDAVTCIHCGAVLPPHTPAAAEPAKQTNAAPASSADSHWYMPANIVEKEIKLARDNVKTGDSVVARLFFRNALAMDRITDPSVETNRSELLRKSIQQCESALCRTTGKCPLCNGTGNRSYQSVDLEGKATFENVIGKGCRMCGGTGRVEKYANQDELKPLLGAGAKRYKMMQEGRKYVTVGGAWIPMNLEDKLSIKQIAMLKGATAPPCDNCLGFCVIACPTCNGVGKIKCPKCDNGMVKEQKKTDTNSKDVKKVGSSLDAVEKCQNCFGTGIVVCDKCQGAQTIMCPRCNGTGEHPDCKTCDGKGWVPCKKCYGTGKVKDAICPICRGEGVILCPSCNGECKRL